MVVHRLSFASIKLLSENIIELIIDKNTLVSIEMVEEFDDYIEQKFQHGLGVLVNKINDYRYCFEAKLTLGSISLIQAIAILNYHTKGSSDTQDIEKMRRRDNLNMKMFSGLVLARDEAINWLATELTAVST